jgi:L-histidine Nalpha-methyltransferase
MGETGIIGSEQHDILAKAVRDGLCRSGQRELPYSLLYDEIGSALFEAISVLPEYGVSRAESRLLRLHAKEVVAQLSPRIAVVELGSGTGSKTRWILEALGARSPVDYYPIDLSTYALAECEKELGTLPSVSITKLNLRYMDGLRTATSQRKPGHNVLVLFLGSTLGNMHPAEATAFLRAIRPLLGPGDGLLLGVDLQKEIDRLLLAYDDPAGVTSAFNLNLLGHINRTLGTNFDLRSFAHEARYNQEWNRIEMHLRSLIDQPISIPGLPEIQFREGETIWTESSYKYDPAALALMAEATEFVPAGQWIDAEWPFAENLWMVP